MNSRTLNLDEEWMREAITLAKEAERHNEVPVGAIIVKDNQVIATGFNQPIKTADPSAHAEMVALRNAGNRLNNYRLVGTTLYVTLEPCLMCVGAMIHARVERLVFGALDPKSGAVESVFKIIETAKLNHRIKVTGEVLAGECGEILSKFFCRKRM